jgi:hypothetical protein
MDSVEINLTVPNGAGGTITKSSTVDLGGYFEFDSIPIGNHDLEVVYLPLDDTLHRFVSVLPASSVYGEYRLANDVWTGGAGGGAGLELIAGRDTVYTTPQCNNFLFWVINNSGGPVTIDGLTLTYGSPTAYYRYVKWGVTTVVDANNPRNGSGDLATFSSAQLVGDGDSVRVQIEAFKDDPTGGANVDMSNADVTVLLSDGSNFVINFGACP